jgi:hypothetical protein
MAKADRAGDGRFTPSDYSNDERYELVREVARQARPDAPHELTMAQFNDAAPFVAKKQGKPKPPKAHTITTSLKKAWKTIVAEALDPSRNVQQTRAANERSEQGLHLDERYINYSLRRVALEIGEDFSDDQYDAGRLALIAKHERHPGNELPLILATSGQILWLADGDWNKARAVAGLPPRTKHRGATPAHPLERLIEHFFETKKRKPSSKEIRPYGNEELGIAVADTGTRHWSEWLERTAEARAERGLAFDDSGPRPDEKLDDGQLAALLEGAAPRKRWGHWTDKENVLDGLCEYVRVYDTVADLRQGHYVANFAGKGWPPLMAIDTHYGGFQDGISAARAELREHERVLAEQFNELKRPATVAELAAALDWDERRTATRLRRIQPKFELFVDDAQPELEKWIPSAFR